uniref:Endonuclease/exonuclease/phosphatase domain-containing protein n=1 Tax=Bombyx mori TaxID=7091 RepID=A0A8R2DL43_BOMMO|nr:craniofacial development protein 2 isoform X1 [Bombyx mori]
MRVLCHAIRLTLGAIVIDPGSRGGKYVTGHCTVDHQVGSGNYATGDGTGKSKTQLRKYLRMGTLNVRGMLKRGKQEVIEREILRCKIDILGLSEVHRRGSGHIKTANGNILCFSGSENHSGNGVAILLPQKLENTVLGYKTPSDRIIAVKLDARPVPINIVQVYAPTSQSEEIISDQFYFELDDLLRTIPSKEVTVMYGDWNAKVGTTRGDVLLGATVGNFGLGVRNDRGEKFLQFCVENQLVIMNTWFEHHPRRLYTWISPSGHRNQIDYITIKSRWRSSVLNTKTLPGADCASDHQLVVADFRLRLKIIKPKFPINIELNKPALGHFHKTVDMNIRSMPWDPCGSSEANWNNLKKVVLDTAKQSRDLHKAVPKHEEWISKESWILIEERKRLKEQGIVNNSQRERYIQLHAEIQRSTRRDRDEHVNNICEEIEGHADKVQTKDIFLKVKQLSKIVEVTPSTEIEHVLERWRNYCYDLYRDEDNLCTIKRWADHLEEPPILLSEVE